MITVSGLSHAFGRAQVLRDIDLDIPKGALTALIGPNGAGKSTLLSLIARLETMQTGRIMVDDLEVGACASQELARTLSILPQVPEIASRLTVAELVAFGRYPHNHGRPTARDTEMIAQALSVFDLDPLRDRALDTLSGGQRQRSLLAMTYAQDTDYMLLDEPLNNLDIAASRNLMRVLKDLSRAHGRTIVVVLHDINYASSYADMIVTMKGGVLGPMGKPVEVVTAENLSSVFETNAQVHQIDGKPLVEV